MKANDVAAKTGRAPPHTFTFGPGGWASTYPKRPTSPVEIGMRRLSADAYLSASLEATGKANEYLPGVDHDDDKWLECHDVLLLHNVIGAALCHPADVTVNYFGAYQDGGAMVGPSPSGEGASSTYFSPEGMARLYDELTVLGVMDSPVWPESSDEELVALGAALQDGTFLPPPPPDDQEVDEVEKAQRERLVANLRRLLGYVVQVRRDGIKPLPVIG